VFPLWISRLDVTCLQNIAYLALLDWFLVLHIVPRIRYLGFTTRGKKGPLITTGDLSACKSKRTLIQLLTVVDAKCALSAKHTASRTNWLHTRKESRDVPVNFFWKLTKDKVVKYQSLELAGWYQTVPYLRLRSQMGWHIAIKSYLPMNWNHSGTYKGKRNTAEWNDVSIIVIGLCMSRDSRARGHDRLPW
jgi:hypothetical protein